MAGLGTSNGLKDWVPSKGLGNKMCEYCCPKKHKHCCSLERPSWHSPGLSKWLRVTAHWSHQSRAVKCSLWTWHVPQHGSNYRVLASQKNQSETSCSQLAQSRSTHRKCHFSPARMLRVLPLQPTREKRGSVRGGVCTPVQGTDLWYKEGFGSTENKESSVVSSRCYLSPPRLLWAEQYLQHASWAPCFSRVPQDHFTRTTAL